MNFSQGHSGTKVQCESCLFSLGKAPEFTKMGEIHELFVLALSLVWFAGATPDNNVVSEGNFATEGIFILFLSVAATPGFPLLNKLKKSISQHAAWVEGACQNGSRSYGWRCAPPNLLHRPQQDTKEYLYQRGTKIRVFRESKNGGGDKGGGEEGRSGGRVNRAWRGKTGEKWGKKGGRKGARKHTRKTLILVPLWFRYSLVAFQRPLAVLLLEGLLPGHRAHLKEG